jgi:hypothetical protein
MHARFQDFLNPPIGLGIFGPRRPWATIVCADPLLWELCIIIGLAVIEMTLMEWILCNGDQQYLP